MKIIHPERLTKTTRETVTVYVDGGCHGNGTVNASGYGSYKVGYWSPVRITYNDADMTNNFAEYKTLIHALRAVSSQNFTARIKMDSALVVNQVGGRWKVKEPRLRKLCDEARALMQETGASLEWVKREEIVSILGH